MNSVFIRKRNDSVNRMLACLAGSEFSVWVLYVSGKSSGAVSVLTVILQIAAVCLALSAIIQYVLACEHYANARGSKNPYDNAGMAFVFSLLVAFFFIGLAAVNRSFWIAYIAMPLGFALGALPIRCQRDRC